MEHRFILYLKQEHEKQRSLGVSLASSMNYNEREKLRKEYFDELYPHMIGEEASIFHFMMCSHKVGVREAALEAIEAHHVAKLVLRELMDLHVESHIFRAKTKVLMDLNDYHIEEEEVEHFTTIQRLCGSDQLDELFATYEDAKGGARGRVNPSSLLNITDGLGSRL